MSKNPNFKSDGDEDNDDNDVNNEKLRRCCCIKRLTRHMVSVPFERGGGSPFLVVQG